MLNVQSIEVNNNTLWMEVEEKVVPAMDQVVPLAEGAVHYGVSDTGVVSFGIWYEEKGLRPGHGGYWSSRAGVVGPLIGLAMVEVVINRTALHMTTTSVELLLILSGLNKQYHVVERTAQGETTYELAKL